MKRTLMPLLGKACVAAAVLLAQAAWANIGGRVWIDNNCNGIFDDGDVLLPGVTVTVYDCDHNTTVGTVLTDQNGFFRLTPEVAGNYKVCVTPPAGFTFAPQVVTNPPAGDCCDSS